MRFAKFISVFAFAFAVSANAELVGMNDQATEAPAKERSWSGLVGVTGATRSSPATEPFS
jgi:hypothetical protein